MAITLQTAKAHLNVTIDEDDALISRLLSAATSHVRRRLGYAIDDTEQFPDGTPDDLEQAVMMLMAHWYENREQSITGTIITSVPFGVDEIIGEHRNYTYG